MVRIKMLRTLTLLSLLAIVTACSNVAFCHFEKIDNNEWREADVLNFKPVLNDSTSLYDLEIAVRHTDDYPFQNIWLYVAHREEYNVKIDTLQLILADDWGRWQGDGHGLVKTFTSLYKGEYKLSKGANFGITIKHAMREDPLPGITDVGLIVKKR